MDRTLQICAKDIQLPISQSGIDLVKRIVHRIWIIMDSEVVKWVSYQCAQFKYNPSFAMAASSLRHTFAGRTASPVAAGTGMQMSAPAKIEAV